MKNKFRATMFNANAFKN